MENQEKIITNTSDKPESENKIDMAFIQVPVEIKEDVQKYVDQLASSLETKKSDDGNPIDSLPAQGCFLVISLEKIEAIIKVLQDCSKALPDEGMQDIKTQINETLSMLN